VKFPAGSMDRGEAGGREARLSLWRAARRPSGKALSEGRMGGEKWEDSGYAAVIPGTRRAAYSKGAYLMLWCPWPQIARFQPRDYDVRPHRARTARLWACPTVSQQSGSECAHSGEGLDSSIIILTQVSRRHVVRGMPAPSLLRPGSCGSFISRPSLCPAHQLTRLRVVQPLAPSFVACLEASHPSIQPGQFLAFM
jgi:hypothetical protein